MMPEIEPIFTYPQLPENILEQIHGELDATGDICAKAEIAVLHSLAADLTRLEDIDQSVHVAILGEIGTALDKMDRVSAKCRDRIINDIQNTLGAAYAYSSLAGVPIPTNDDVRIFASTGNDTPNGGRSSPTASQPIGGIGGTGQGFPTLVTKPGGIDSTIIDPSPRGNGDLIEPPPSLPGPVEPKGGSDGPIPKDFPFPQCPTFMVLPPDQFRPMHPTDMFPGRCRFIQHGSSNIVIRPEDQKPFTYGGFTVLCPLVPQDNDTESQAIALGFRKWCPKLSPHPQEQTGSNIYAPPGWFPIMFTDGAQYFVNVQSLSHYNACYFDCTQGTGQIPPAPPQKPGPGPGPQQCIPICQPQCPPCDDQKPGDKPPEDECKPVKPDLCPLPPDKGKMPDAPEKDNYCDKLTEYVNRLGDDIPSVSTYIGAAPAKGWVGSTIQKAVTTALGFSGQIFPEATHRFAKWIEKCGKDFSNGLACDRGKMGPLAVLGALLGVIQHWFNIIPPQTVRALEQASNFVCQSKIPQTGDINISYLNGTLTKEEWECLQKANGNYLEPMEKIMKAGRKKPVAEEYILLYRRGYIGKEHLNELLKTAGVIDEFDREDLLKVTEQWPTQSEDIRFMTRDVADEEKVDWTEVDKLFKDKFKGRVKQYAEALGIKEKHMLDSWRAHFHLPSYTMGTEMLHRLRPGKDGVTKPIDREKLRQLLIQDDWHPDWIDPMIDISYKRVTRTDSIRAYYIHSTTDDEFHSQIMDQGYTKEDADFFLKFHKRNRQIMDRRRAGYPTLRMLSNQYARCEITEQAFRETINLLSISDEQTQAAIDASRLSRSVRKRQQGIRAIRRPFVQGIIDEAQAQEALTHFEVDGRCISDLIEVWKIDRVRQDKRLNASQLCQMREFGIITVAEQIDALVRTNWSLEDALRIAELCGTQLSEKEKRRAEALARRQAADMRRAAREAKKAQRELLCGPPDCPTNTPGGQKRQGNRLANPQNPQGNTGSNGHSSR